MCAATLLLAYLSWRYVEQPFRDRRSVSRKAIFAAAAFIGILTSTSGAAAFMYEGFPVRFGLVAPVEQATDQADAADGPKCFLKDKWTAWSGDACMLSKGTGGTVLIWGDSHVNHYRDAIRQAAPPLDVNVLMYATAGCLPVFGYAGIDRDYCRSNNDHVTQIIKDYKVDTVVMSGYWWRVLRNKRLTFADIEHTIERLKALGVQVKLIGDNPDFPFANPQFLAYRLSKKGAPASAYYMPVRNDHSVNQRLSQMVPPEDFIDPMRILCKESQCLAYDNGNILMVDNAHLSRYGSTLVFEQMRPIFEPGGE
jgi:hypothetical protein